MIQRYANENKLAQKMLLNGSKVKEDYGVKYVPTVFWIDREGFVRSMAMGESTVADLEKRTQAILGKKG